ncbi:MAG: type I-E CRISPR-associated protein Cas5/CasD [Christensenellaceae bacterium]|jgi:CRISPR system Cascade subunit CasD|nr:type I-E CRISPR-associated protein Cas5/CasD [Christensenellaceae bacterium]
MSTLLLRLAAPMQAWGTSSRFTQRSTSREPSKSGVIGLLAAALGRRRDADLADLSALRFGVRIDQPGVLLRDFHTAHVWEGASAKQSFVSERHYLADALFLVGLEGDEALLKLLDEALQSPSFPLYLGRRSCPPTGRLSLGLRAAPLGEALKAEPWLAAKWYRDKERRREDVPPGEEMPRLELVLDAAEGSVLSRDLPLSFDPAHRRYGFRTSSRETLSVQGMNQTEHDPFLEMGEDG